MSTWRSWLYSKLQLQNPFVESRQPQSTSRQETDSSAHLNKWKQHHVSLNSRLDPHSPKALYRCGRWLAKLICQSEGGERSFESCNCKLYTCRCSCTSGTTKSISVTAYTNMDFQQQLYFFSFFAATEVVLQQQNQLYCDKNCLLFLHAASAAFKANLLLPRLPGCGAKNSSLVNWDTEQIVCRCKYGDGGANVCL